MAHIYTIYLGIQRASTIDAVQYIGTASLTELLQYRVSDEGIGTLLQKPIITLTVRLQCLPVQKTARSI